MINSFQVFDIVYLMTNGGGPGRSSLVMVQYIYENAFEYFDMGYASAIATVFFAIILFFHCCAVVFAPALDLPARSKAMSLNADAAAELRRWLTLGLVYLVLIFFAIITLAPLAWAISTSLKPNADVFGFPPQWIPENPRWSNYTDAWEIAPFARFYWNSFYITVLIVGGQLLTSSLAGFAFARMRFPARDTLFLLYLAALMIPSQVIMIPIFLMVKELGWVNSHLSLIIPSLATPFGTFLFRQFFLGIPEDLVDAAKLDGCSPFGRLLARLPAFIETSAGHPRHLHRARHMELLHLAPYPHSQHREIHRDARHRAAARHDPIPSPRGIW